MEIKYPQWNRVVFYATFRIKAPTRRSRPSPPSCLVCFLVSDRPSLCRSELDSSAQEAAGLTFNARSSFTAETRSSEVINVTGWREKRNGSLPSGLEPGPFTGAEVWPTNQKRCLQRLGSFFRPWPQKPKGKRVIWWSLVCGRAIVPGTKAAPCEQVYLPPASCRARSQRAAVEMKLPLVALVLTLVLTLSLAEGTLLSKCGLKDKLEVTISQLPEKAKAKGLTKETLVAKSKSWI